jgi:hypothetical protein
VPCTPFVLPCSSRTCEEISLRSPTSCSTVSVWLRRIVWISPGLWFCDRSEIELKSFAVSVPLSPSFGHNQPLSGIKLVIPAILQKFILCSRTYCREDRAILVLIQVGIYQVLIRAIIVTVGFVFTHLLMVNSRQPSDEITFGVGKNFVYYPLVLTPLV